MCDSKTTESAEVILRVDGEPAVVDGMAVPEEPSVARTRRRQLLRALFTVYLSVFIDMMGVSLIIPIIPFLAIELDATDTQVGYIFAAYAAAQMISTPITGRLSDKIGRRPLLLASLLGSCGGFLMQGLARSVGFLIFARAAAGAFGGSIPIAQAFIADNFPQHERPRYFAIQGVVLTLAFTFGPGIGAGLAEFSLQTPMFVASAVAAVGFVLAFCFFHSPKTRPAADESTSAAAASTSALQAAEEAAVDPERFGAAEAEAADKEQDTELGPSEVEAKDGGGTTVPTESYRTLIALMWGTAFLMSLAMSAQIYVSGLYLHARFGWRTLEIGFLSMGAAIFGIFVQVLAFPRLLKRIGRHGSAIAGSFVMGMGFAALACLGTSTMAIRGIPLTCFSYALLAFGQVITMTATTSILSRYASAQTQGFTLGVSQSLQALARVVGPIVWTNVFTTVAVQAPFWAASLISLLSTLGYFGTLCLNRRLPERLAARAQQRTEKAAEAAAAVVVVAPKATTTTTTATTTTTTAPTTSTTAAAAAVAVSVADAALISKGEMDEMEMLLAENVRLRVENERLLAALAQRPQQGSWREVSGGALDDEHVQIMGETAASVQGMAR